MVYIDLVVGCRPNFVKAAALVNAVKMFPEIRLRLLHTGQHNMQISKPYFDDLELPTPDKYFGDLDNYPDPSVRLGKMVADLGNFWDTDEIEPDYVMVVGDTDSTLAGAIAAKKSMIPLIHVEAGLRCEDDDMQEQINRKLVDSVSDILYTTTRSATTQLVLENKRPWNCVFVGNVMVDTLNRFLPKAIQRHPSFRSRYGMLTLHRAENVYNPDRMHEIADAVMEVCKNIQVIFPMHPRHHMQLQGPGLTRVEPMGYLEFIAAMARAQFVITDSGGVQEETTILGVPCVTVRDSTERPETICSGTNTLVGTNGGEILKAVENSRFQRDSKTPELWDGQSAGRIFKDILERQ